MLNKLKTNWLIIAILIIAGVIRFWNLGNIPPSLTPDEASLGYNAYSIFKTGRDEYGKFLPIIFKSFGDYKPGLYVYLTIPFVAVFGLNEWSVRLPSAISGIIIVYLSYLIANKFLNKKFALVTALIASTNPWLIFFARGAWEANVSLMFTLLGIYFFQKSVHRSLFTVHSAFFCALTLLTYQGAKLSTFIVVLVLGIIYFKDVIKIPKSDLAKAFLVGLIISSPIIISLFNGQSQRLEVFSIFSYRRPVEETQKFAGKFYNVFNSEPLNYFRAIAGRWFNVFSGKFLFFEGDSENPVHTAPYHGVMLLSDLLFLPLGLFYLFRSKTIQPKALYFILFWLLLAPLSASISRDTTNAVRSLNTAIPLILISSFGLYFLINNFKKFSVFYLAFIFLAFIYFCDSYFVHLSIHNSKYFRYGYKEAFNYISQNKSKYNAIVFEQSYNQPYIYYLFYNRKLLTTNLSKGENIKDVGLVRKIDGIEFATIDWQVLRNQKNILIISSQNPMMLPVKKEIKYLNRVDTAFNIIEL